MTDAVVEIPPLLVAARAASVRVAVRSPSRLLGGPEPFAATLLRELETIRLLRLLARDVKLGELPLAILPRLVFERALERVPLGSRATTREVLSVRARAYSSSTSRIASRTSSESISPFAARFSRGTRSGAKPCASRASRVSTSADAKHPKVSVSTKGSTSDAFAFAFLSTPASRTSVSTSKRLFCLARRLSTPNRFLHRDARGAGRLPRNVRRLSHLLRVLRRFVQFLGERSSVRSLAGWVSPPRCVFFSRAFDVSDGVPVLVRGEENFSVGVRSTEPLARHDATGDGESDRAAKLGAGHESVPVEVRGS